jgi:hypothetical protein
MNKKVDFDSPEAAEHLAFALPILERALKLVRSPDLIAMIAGSIAFAEGARDKLVRARRIPIRETAADTRRPAGAPT